MAKTQFDHEQAARGEGYREKLSSKLITVCGAGALGSNVSESLVRMGVSRIRIVDLDRVATENLGNQAYRTSDVGMMKVHAMRNILFAAAGVQAEVEGREMTEGNVRKLLRDSAVVLDCFDNSASRRLVQEECRRQRIPCLHAGLYGEGGFGDVTWDEVYRVPPDPPAGDPCDLPLSRSIVMLTAAVTVEEVLDYLLEAAPRRKSWTLTQRDLCIRSKT